MTRLEIMNENKKAYAEQEKKIGGMAPGLEKEVAVRYILPWIKGRKWLGGMSDSAANRIVEKIEALGYDEYEIMDEMDRQLSAFI